MSISRRSFIKGTAAATLLADLTLVKQVAAETASNHIQESAQKRGYRALKDDY